MCLRHGMKVSLSAYLSACLPTCLPDCLCARFIYGFLGDVGGRHPSLPSTIGLSRKMKTSSSFRNRTRRAAPHRKLSPPILF